MQYKSPNGTSSIGNALLQLLSFSNFKLECDIIPIISYFIELKFNLVILDQQLICLNMNRKIL